MRRGAIVLITLSVGCASGDPGHADRTPAATVEVSAVATATAEATASSNPSRDALLALKEPDAPASSGSTSAASAQSASAKASSRAAPDASSVKAAREIFQQGVKAFSSGDYAAARAAFEAAYSLSPTASVLYNLGQAAMKGGDVAIACDAFQRYVSESKPAVPPARVVELRKQCPKLR